MLHELLRDYYLLSSATSRKEIQALAETQPHLISKDYLRKVRAVVNLAPIEYIDYSDVSFVVTKKGKTLLEAGSSFEKVEKILENVASKVDSAKDL